MRAAGRSGRIVAMATAERDIGSELEHDRLAHRALRLERVVEELRARAHAHRRARGHAPRPLTQALVGFETELRTVRSRLERTR
jgi:hypothetical protein